VNVIAASKSRTTSLAAGLRRADATTLALRARNAVGGVIESLPTPGPQPLAAPPPESGLKPVMGEPGLPVVGQVFGFLTDPIGQARTGYELYGTVAWGGGPGGRVVRVLGPEGIGTVLANRDRAFSNEDGWNFFIGPFFRRGVMLMDFEEHHHHRRIMQNAFKRERLTAYLDTMNPAIARGIDGWQPGQIRLYRAAKQLTLDIATEVFMGHRLGPEADRINRAFVDVVVGGQGIIRADVPVGRWGRGLRSRRWLEDYFRRQIPAKRAGEGDDLFSVLCHAESDDGERFSDDDVVNHMIFTMMAAHDTSTITVAMMGWYLARHPDWQERVRSECLALGKDAISFDDLDALPAMDLVFKETLRINAPVGMLARQALVDTAIDGHYIPAGTTIMLGIFQTQRMEPWWRSPDTFDPGRFTPERAEDQSHKYAWVPFGGNVHKCIGMHFGSMEVKAIIHQLLLRYSLHAEPGYEPLIDYATGPYPGDGLPIELRPRPI
jgi:cytochrome P450